MYEMIVGLYVKDDQIYDSYRMEMKPLLEKRQGGFRYDFRVSETLKNEEKKPINRVFAIYFGSKDLMDDFFSDPVYLKIKEKYFLSSVEHTTIISEYQRASS